MINIFNRKQSDYHLCKKSPSDKQKEIFLIKQFLCINYIKSKNIGIIYSNLVSLISSIFH